MTEHTEAQLVEVAKAIYEGMSGVADGKLPDDWDALGPEHDKARKEWIYVAGILMKTARPFIQQQVLRDILNWEPKELHTYSWQESAAKEFFKETYGIDL